MKPMRKKPELLPPEGKPKILVFDIETAPYLIEAWGTYKTNALDIVREWFLLCFAYAWYDYESQTIGEIGWVGLPDTKRWKPHSDLDEDVASKLWTLFDEADIIIGQNHDRFDIRKANERFFVHGWEPPSPYTTVDLKKHYRTSFMGSAALKYMTRKAGVSEKMSTSGYSLWQGCMAGDKLAWDEMKMYNIQDVRATTEVYVKLLPWIGRLGKTAHPNLAHFVQSEGYVCPNCGNKEREHGGMGHQRRGFYNTAALRYPKMRCNKCGRYGKHWQAERDSRTTLR